MKVTFHGKRKRYRIIIPPGYTGTGKRQIKYFKEKPDAETAMREAIGRGLSSSPQPEVTPLDRSLLDLIKAKYGDDAEKVLHALGQQARMNAAITKPDATLEQACIAYIHYHVAEQSNRRTIYKYRSTLRRLCADLGGKLPIVELSLDMVINIFLKRWEPGGTRATQQRNVNAFVAWAAKPENGYLATNPLADRKLLDQWEPNKEILTVEQFQKLLTTAAAKFPRLVPYFVLGGFAGVRRCEMISSTSADHDPRIEWRDINFKTGNIRIRHEVAKETNALDRKRSIPLEPAAREWLGQVMRTEGPVMEISQSTLQRDLGELTTLVKFPVPENALRNSFASYGAAFRSLGDVARAMGDTEATVKRYYVDLVDDPDLGRAWFNIRPGAGSKIVPMEAAG